MTLPCGCVLGTRFGCRNLEKGGCSLYWYCRQKPGGAKGKSVGPFYYWNDECSCCCLYCYMPHIHLVCSGLYQDYKPEEDPCKFRSAKTGRGPLGPDWKVNNTNIFILTINATFRIMYYLLLLHYYFWCQKIDSQRFHCRVLECFLLLLSVVAFLAFGFVKQPMVNPAQNPC